MTKLTGLETLQQIIDGTLPPPNIDEIMPMKLVKVAYGYAEFQARAGSVHLNPAGIVHGGFTATVLDSVAGCALQTTLPAERFFGTVDLNIQMLKPVPVNQLLIAEGKLIHVSKRLGVSEAYLKDEAGTILAHATSTCLVMNETFS